MPFYCHDLCVPTLAGVILHFHVASETQVKLVGSEAVVHGAKPVADSTFPVEAELDVKFDHIYVRRKEGRWEMGIVFETKHVKEMAMQVDEF